MFIFFSIPAATRQAVKQADRPILYYPNPHSVSLVNLFIYTSVFFFNFNKKLCLHGWWVFEICMFTIPSFNMHLSQRYYPILVATRVEPIERTSSTCFSLSLLCLFKLFFCKWQLEEPCWYCCCCWLHTKQMHYFKDIIKIASFLFLFRIPKS